jgi:hypothetical protein
VLLAASFSQAITSAIAIISGRLMMPSASWIAISAQQQATQ